MPDAAASRPITRPDAPAVLRVEGLSFAYRSDAPVLRGLDATLVPGRLTVLVGPNASGKSTLLRCMLGQLAPSAGRVLLGEKPVEEMSARRRARAMAYVPQQGGAGFGFTVAQVVAMGRYAHGRAGGKGGGDDSIVNEALARCGVADLAQRVFAQLSGGQRQRVMIARAWAQSRGGGSVLLADEPVSSLDPRHAWEALNLLAQLAAEGLAVLVVLHDLTQAGRWARDAWLIDEGRIVAAGSAETVLRRRTLEPVYGVRFALPGDASSHVFCVEGLRE